MKNARNLALALIGACALLAGCANDEANSTCAGGDKACTSDGGACCKDKAAKAGECCKKDGAQAAPAKQ